jgi:hypothetical protein
MLSSYRNIQQHPHTFPSIASLASLNSRGVTASAASGSAQATCKTAFTTRPSLRRRGLEVGSEISWSAGDCAFFVASSFRPRNSKWAEATARTSGEFSPMPAVKPKHRFHTARRPSRRYPLAGEFSRERTTMTVLFPAEQRRTAKLQTAPWALQRLLVSARAPGARLRFLLRALK